MDPRSRYELWAAAGSPWSPWVKPVLFAHMDGAEVAGALPDFELPAIERLGMADRATALVVNLPGAEAVSFGLEFARHGYRPVPLFNGAPGPAAVVPVESIMNVLRLATAPLMSIRLDDAAPPAFLLDANRRSLAAPTRPGMFDNRWIVFPQDLPSSGFLKSQGIGRVVLVQRVDNVDDDLAHVLLRWQNDGLVIELLRVDRDEPPRTITVRRPPRFGNMWYRLLAMLGLRRNSTAGFGGVIPQPPSSGGRSGGARFG